MPVSLCVNTYSTVVGDKLGHLAKLTSLTGGVRTYVRGMRKISILIASVMEVFMVCKCLSAISRRSQNFKGNQFMDITLT